MSDDRNSLIHALKAAVERWREWRKDKNLLLQYSPPDRSVIEPLESAIEQCAVFRAVDGQSLFSGDVGVVLTAGRLALSLLHRAIEPAEEPAESAVDWLIRLLKTRQAHGVYIAAIWGLQVDREIEIAKGISLLPIISLRDSFMKRRIVEAAKKQWNRAVYTSHRYFDVPGAAIVRTVSDFPYIGSPSASFGKLFEIEAEIKNHLVFLEAAAAGQASRIATSMCSDQSSLAFTCTRMSRHVIALPPHSL